jgi:hypothetical protein
MSDITTCPRCRREVSPHVTERGLVCPHCQNPLAGVGLEGLAAPDVDTDVRRRVSLATIILVVLITANAVAIGAAFYALEYLDQACCFLILFAVLDLLVIVAVMRPFANWLQNSKRLGDAGKLFAFVLLGLVVAVGVVIIFFTACVGLINLARP